MRRKLPGNLRQIASRAAEAIDGPQILAFLPAVVLGAYWIGGEPWLLGVAIGLPLLHLLLPKPRAESEAGSAAEAIEQVLSDYARDRRVAAVMVLGFDDREGLRERFGAGAMEIMTAEFVERLQAELRGRDHVFSMSVGLVCVITASGKNMDHKAALRLGERMQRAVEKPLRLDRAVVHLTVSAGFCLTSRNPGKSVEAIYEAASAAFRDAQNNGPSAIRAFDQGMQSSRAVLGLMAAEAAEALENGEMRAWFQPQVSAVDGVLSGFEVLARWMHPERGLIAPAEFLPVLEGAGLLPRLGEVMRQEAYRALRAWDGAGVEVPSVAVNFSAAELRDPALVDRIRWELDHHDLGAELLTIEVLETVVSTAVDDSVALSINGLAKLGCSVDLDDFGTGHASITSLRRFAVRRIKIDRSFVMKLDRDPEQHQMVVAILGLAERLGLETLAEGVETMGEQICLGEIGCNYVQGFGIARPMAFEQTIDWIKSRTEKRIDRAELRKA